MTNLTIIMTNMTIIMTKITTAMTNMTTVCPLQTKQDLLLLFGKVGEATRSKLLFVKDTFFSSMLDLQPFASRGIFIEA